MWGNARRDLKKLRAVASLPAGTSAKLFHSSLLFRLSGGYNWNDYRFYFINRNYPQLSSLYREIYRLKNKVYWHELDKKIAVYAEEAGLKYLGNIDPDINDEKILSVIVNYFFHEELVNI